MHLLKKTCRISGEMFEISQKEADLYTRMHVPLPTLNPTERFRSVMAFRNEWKLYRRTCDATKKEIISAYPPDAPFKVFHNTTWWGDGWDAMEFGQEFNFNRPFFEQFAELQKKVPREGTTIFQSENCDYNSHIRKSRNCYLNSLVANCEDLYYSYWAVNDRDVYDCALANDSTLCYECVDVNRCYECAVLHESNDCNTAYFSYQLQGCDHCLFSTNLVHKSYHIFNKPCTKEEFEAARKKIFSGSWKTWQKAMADFTAMRSKALHRSTHTLQCENCLGDHIYRSKNCINCYDSFDGEDCFHSVSIGGSKDTSSIYSAGWPGCELTYYSVVSRGCINIAFCNYSWFCTNIRYCDSCVSSQDCFGCIGLKHKQYCILNKQYSEEEYRTLVGKIVAQMERTGEWGEFFPPNLSPYAYNETAAQDYFPLKKEEALARGYRWREPVAREYLAATILVLPDTIADIDDSILQAVLKCKLCDLPGGQAGKNFKLIPQELKWYKRLNVPLPRHCPSCRHEGRIRFRNPFQLWNSNCSACGAAMKTTFPPKSAGSIFCDACYLETVF